MNENLIDDGKNIYRYDALDRLRQVVRRSNNVTVAKYAYDELNRRTKKVVSNPPGPKANARFIYSGWSKIEERSGSTRKQFVWRCTMDEMSI